MTDNTQQRDRTIALAAVMQAVHLVHNIATQGQADEADVIPLLESLLVQDADSTEAVYGGLSNLKTGLEQLRIQLVDHKTKHEVTQIQYAANLLRLERKLDKHSSIMDMITQDIERLPEKIEESGAINSPEVVAYLADLYKRTISNLTPFVEVHGEEIYLTNYKHANLIRALLLTGIRAAIIWKQKKGGYWRLLWQAKQLAKTTETLQASL